MMNMALSFERKVSAALDSAIRGRLARSNDGAASFHHAAAAAG